MLKSMRHAGEGALDHLEPMLRALRAMPALREKARGTFYRGSRAFIRIKLEQTSGLHCHGNRPANLLTMHKRL
jgi:hypothetical protein